MDKQFRKPWIEPKLIVLFRGRPEEVLTTDCKHPNFPSGYGAMNSSCQVFMRCRNCFARNNKS